MITISDNKKIELNGNEQLHYEYIVQNRVLKQFQDDKTVIFAIDNTVSKEIKNELKLRFKNYNVQFNLLDQKEFDTLLREITKTNSDHYKIEELKNEKLSEDLTKLASDAPIINLVNGIILSAINKKASDIHFEPYENYFRVRFRINGYLQQEVTYPIKLFEAVCARIKVLSKLDITQRRLAQDGKVLLNFYDKNLDIRTSTLPTVYGESIVLRLLGLTEGYLDLTHLGFSKKDITTLQKIINHSYGAFILTGPTGSGKTTTLNAILHQLDSKIKKIITIEDPVEYTIEGINQVQINDKIGLDFKTILRNILRQDPDIIMVGEIRDSETADLALRAAMTGHLVLTTLHTNDAISSIPRLVNMGIERYIIESSVLAFGAQRLARVLCPYCKEKQQIGLIDKNLFKKYNIEIDFIYKPKGCSECNFTGFLGRKGIFEIVEVDEMIKEFIIENAPLIKIRKYLKEKNFISIFQKGLKKIAEGEFFLDEIKSIINDTN